ncbi:hypothetical protein [Bradyrhizobium sp. JYMT SZCCT0428]|uniref:hypothetical protein n=1 Tax=Bradyrhizobium sp. JYMT SZCCT0428 TaxID=2807673 RepID=UPI001BA59366|nr:hypothetical protein [Bradyrhizobium sp. JYMT SZCCT0428]MBR1154391.1 hypothetical protein [Bradyrhizobium sp. JYMT SZCCT0428]
MDGRLIVLKRFVEALGEPADISSIDSRKRFQKAVYLGQLAGVDLGYRYSWYVRGPYSTALTKDYYALASALAAGDQPPEDKKLKPALQEKLAALRGLFTVPPDVGLDEPAWYELLASWHYLLKVSGLAPQKAQETMSSTKPHLVSYISKADQELRQRRLLD